MIDYTQQDFTQNSETYDLIFDILGRCRYGRCKKSLKPEGRLLYASFKMGHLSRALWNKLTSGHRVICAISPMKVDVLARVKELAEAGTVKPIIDQCFPLEQAAQAHRYIEDGHKKGHIVLTT